MKTLNRLVTLGLIAFLGFTVAACDDDPIEETEPAETAKVDDLAADPTTGRDPTTGAPIATGKYTLYSFERNEVVSSAESHAPADSSSEAWDIGFRGTDIILNTGVNGPGNAGVIVQTGVFEEFMQAPVDGYEELVPGGSGGGWYNYAGAPTHVISPIPGRFLVVRTGTGEYAKIKILNYYKGAPDYSDPGFDAFAELDRHYTFEFVYQPEGDFGAE